MSKDRIVVWAVEKEGGYFYVSYGRTELSFWQGGCLVEESKYFTSPYDQLSKSVTVPRKLFERLRSDINYLSEQQATSTRFLLDKNVERVELRILTDERRLANIARKQGVELDEYFESYKGVSFV